MKKYIEYRVYIHDDPSPDVDGMGNELLIRVADELQDMLNISIQSNCVAFAGTFVDLSDVVVEGDATYTLHLSDEEVEPSQDTGRYESGYRVFRDGSYREDFGSDR